MACHFNDLQPTSGLCMPRSYMMMSLLYRSKTKHGRLLIAISRLAKNIMGSRDINLGRVHETILSDVSKPYMDDQ